jgi:hypothetical protein
MVFYLPLRQDWHFEIQWFVFKYKNAEDIDISKIYS